MLDEGSLHEEAIDSEGNERRAHHEDAGPRRSLPPPRRRGLASALINIARGRWSLAANVIVAASRVAHLADQEQRAFRRETQDALGQVLRGEVNVALVVDQPRDLASINYCQQGDSSLYSEEALARRSANRTHPDFVEAVREWWRWLPKAQTNLLGVLATAATAPERAEEAKAAPAEEAAADAEVAVDHTGGASEQQQQQQEEQLAEQQPTEAVEAAEGSAGGDGGELAQPPSAFQGRELQADDAVPEPEQGRTAAPVISEAPEAETEPSGGRGGELAEAGAAGEELLGEGEVVEGRRSRADLEGPESGCLSGDNGGSGGGAGEALVAASSAGSVGQAVEEAVVEGGAGAAGGGGGLVEWQGGGVQVAALDEPIYSAMVVVITWVLLPRFGIRADLEYDPSQDWLDDNEGQPYMDFKHFFDSMFDLADVWSVGVEAAQYVNLLVSLLQDVQQLETSQAAFTRLLHKFRSAKQPPPAQQQEPHQLPLQQQSLQQHHHHQHQHESSPLHAHAFETKPAHPSETKPDPRLAPSAAATSAAHRASGVTVVMAAAAVTPRGATGRTHPPPVATAANHAAASITAPGGMPTATAATPFVVTFPARSASAASQPLPYRLSGSVSRATSPSPGFEPHGRRDATFKLMPSSRMDVSGIRSPLAEYLRGGAPQPDRATLEQWRRSRTSSSSQGLQREGREASIVARRGRSPSAVALSAELLLGPQAAGGRDGGDGAVLMYEEYMHDMAARYLVQQQKVLVATSAGAAAAAGQLLAAAATASEQRAWEGDGAVLGTGSPPPAGPPISNDSSMPAPLQQQQQRSHSAAAAAVTASPGSSRNSAAQSSEFGTAALAAAAAAEAAAGAPTRGGGAGSGGTPTGNTSPRGSAAAPSSQPPGLMPPPLPSLAAPTIDLHLMAYMQPVCVVGHAVQAEQPAGPGGGSSSLGGGARTNRSPFRRHSRTIPAPAATSLAASESTSPATPPPPPPPAAAAAAGASTGAGAAGGGAQTRESPFRRPASVSAVAAAAAAAPERQTDGPEVAESGSAAHAQTQAQTQAQAQAQAQVVVAFAAAAYRLSDPNVHSLLLPARLAASVRSREAALAAQSQVGATAKALSPARSFSARMRSGSPPSARARPAAAAGSALQSYLSGTPLERLAPYIGPVASAMCYAHVPQPQPSSDNDGGLTPADGASDSAATATANGADTVATPPWPPIPVSGGAEHLGQMLPAPSVSPPGTPSLDASRRPSTAAAHGGRTSVSTLSAAAAAAPASLLGGGAATRHLASAIPSRPAGLSAARHTGQWAPGSLGGEPVSAATSPQPYSDSAELYHPQLHNPHPHHPHHGMEPAWTAAAVPASPGGAATITSAAGGGGGRPLSSRWASSPPTWSAGAPGLVQTPRSGLRTSGSTAAMASGSLSAGLGGGRNGYVRGGSFTFSTPGGFAGGGASGSGRRSSAAPGLYGGGIGGGGPGGVMLPNAVTAAKLRSSYSSPPVGFALTSWEGASASAALLPPANSGNSANTLHTNGAASAASSRRGSRSSCTGEPAATGSAPGCLPLVTGDAAAGGEAGRPYAAQPSAADYAAWRRSHTLEYAWQPNNHHPASPAGGGAAAAAAWAGSGEVMRSPVRIRSSEPVGFADAVTAARMNVAIMADELLQRQAEQRTHTKLMRERTLQLRPTTAAAVRHSFPNSFGAFMAMRETGGGLGLATGAGAGLGAGAEAAGGVDHRSAAAVAGHWDAVSGA